MEYSAKNSIYEIKDCMGKGKFYRLRRARILQSHDRNIDDLSRHVLINK